MMNDISPYRLDDYEELIGRFEKAKLEPSRVLLKVSSRWYALPKDDSLIKALGRLRAGQRIAILNLDGIHRIRIEGGVPDD